MPAWHLSLSRGRVALGSFMPALRGALGSPLLGPSPVSMRRTSRVLTVRWRLSQLHSPASPLLLRVPSLQLPPEAFRPRALPARVSSLFAASPKASNFASAPNRLLVPPSGFVSLSTVCSAFGSAGLFHPATTSRVCCPGASPTAQPPSFIRKSFPLAVEARTAASALAPQSTPLDFEALLRAGMRSSGTGFRRSFGRSPLQFSPSPGSLPSRHEPNSPGHPLLALPDEVFARALTSLESPSASCQRDSRLVCLQTAGLLEVSSRPLTRINGEAPVRRWSTC